MLPSYQQMLLPCVESISAHDDIWQFLDREHILTVATADPFELEGGSFGNEGRAVLVNVGKLAMGLLWYTGRDSPCAVEYPVTGSPRYADG